MQQDHQWTIFWAGLDDMQANAIGSHKVLCQVFHIRKCGSVTVSRPREGNLVANPFDDSRFPLSDPNTQRRQTVIRTPLFRGSAFHLVE